MISPAKPWRYTPRGAAWYDVSFCAISAPIKPLSTSPLPAVAIPGLPERFRYLLWSGSAVTVCSSFRTQITWFSSAKSAAVCSRFFWISPTVFPVSLLISPRCGVITAVFLKFFHLSAPCTPVFFCSATRFNASASKRNALFSCDVPYSNTKFNICAEVFSFPSPGPITMASDQSRISLRTGSSGTKVLS